MIFNSFSINDLLQNAEPNNTYKFIQSYIYANFPNQSNNLELQFLEIRLSTKNCIRSKNLPEEEQKPEVEESKLTNSSSEEDFEFEPSPPESEG
jgi:hypothetical protein